jgi:hypothetical protein
MRRGSVEEDPGVEKKKTSIICFIMSTTINLIEFDCIKNCIQIDCRALGLKHQRKNP